jgi:hypothetical protein
MSDTNMVLKQVTERHPKGVLETRKRYSWECQQCGYRSKEKEEVKEHKCDCELCYEGNCPHSCHLRFTEN